MGQYYKPIILKERDGDNPEEIERWWLAHDFDNGLKLMEHSWIGNDFVAEVEHYLIDNPSRLVWAGDYADEEPDGDCLYFKANDSLKHEHEEDFDWKNETSGICVINHDKKEYYIRPAYDEDKWQVNPLPLLTCEGNGRGGGDYHDNDPFSRVGSWARDIIELTYNKPDESYLEIHPDFYEE